jgi:apolipoprotein N-acyltransferase
MTALPLGLTPRQGILASAAGLLGAVAFWPISLWPLMLASLVHFLRLLRDQDVQSARNIGLVYGLTFAAGTMHWMFGIFGVLAIPLLAIMATYFGLLATLFALTRGFNAATRVGLTAVFAVAVEWLRGDACWYLRFPWYTPAHALASAPPMVAGARWLGTYGLSLLIWLIAAAGAFRLLAYLGFLLLPACWLLLPPNGKPDCRVVLVQSELGSIEPAIAAVPDEKADLCVLPELAYTCSPQSALSGRNGPAALAHKTRCPVVFGAVEGTDVGKVGHVVLSFAHRSSWTPAYWLSFLGPAAAVGTLVFLLWLGMTRVINSSTRLPTRNSISGQT